MSQQTQIPLTAEQAQTRANLARRRMLILNNAPSIFVQVEKDGAPATVPLNSLRPVERAKMIQKLLTDPAPEPVKIEAPAPAAPTPIAPDTASSGKAPSRFTSRTKKATASATKKAVTKKAPPKKAAKKK